MQQDWLAKWSLFLNRQKSCQKMLRQCLLVDALQRIMRLTYTELSNVQVSVADIDCKVEDDNSF